MNIEEQIMTTYFITRHPGALAWAKQKQLSYDIHQEHLHCIADFKLGDTVIGSLPINLVYKLNQQGVRYLHLSLELPRNLRGIELSAEQLNECQAELEEFHVTQINWEDKTD